MSSRGKANKMGRRITLRLAVLLAGMVFWGTFNAGEAVAQGAGDLLINPKRIVFEGRQRTAEVALVNKGTQTATYRISFQDMRMSEQGALQVIDSLGPDERSAESLLRFSPRQVVLGPGEAQVIRLLVRKPGDLPPGEYRSHLLLRALPPEDAGTNIETVDRQDGEISVRITLIYGVSIPVIVRQGDLSAAVALSDLALNTSETTEGETELFMRLDRSGDRSAYGDFGIEFTPDVGESVTVGQVRGVAVYTPNDFREVRIALNPPEGVALRNGRLNVTYRSQPESGATLLAEAALELP